MTDGHDERDEFDEFDDRLRDNIEPLPPPPGTYARIRRQARRRRLAKAMAVGAAAVVVVAGGVAVPRMIRSGQPETFVPQTTGSRAIQTPRATTAKPSHSAPEHTTRPHPSNGTTDTGELSATPHHSTPPPDLGPTRCHTADLSAHLTGSDAGAGQRYAGLVLTNTSSKPCTLYGYVGIGLLGKDGAMPTNLIRDAGPQHHLTVSPGESAATSLHWSAIPGRGEDSGCPAPTGVQITPPDETTQLTTAWRRSPVCQHGELHTVPLVAGDSPPPI